MELCCVLLYFEAVTGLRVNLEKEELVPAGKTSGVGDLAKIIGFKMSSYL